MAAARLKKKAAPAAAVTSALRRELEAHRDPARASAMQAYMKSTMPFFGVPAPVVRAICKRVFAEHPPSTARDWQRDVLAIFRGAEHREEWYCAIALCDHRAARGFHTMDALPMYEELIVESAWWDVVDALASHGLSRILENEPEPMARAMLAWSRDADMWKRRSSILCQLPRGADTDVALLHACIEPSLDSTEFFLRKAIGWALRQYARTAPADVRAYVEANRARMSGLTIREATKHLGASPRPRPTLATSSPARGARRRRP